MNELSNKIKKDYSMRAKEFNCLILLQRNSIISTSRLLFICERVFGCGGEVKPIGRQSETTVWGGTLNGGILREIQYTISDVTWICLVSACSQLSQQQTKLSNKKGNGTCIIRLKVSLVLQTHRHRCFTFDLWQKVNEWIAMKTTAAQTSTSTVPIVHTQMHARAECGYQKNELKKRSGEDVRMPHPLPSSWDRERGRGCFNA